MKMIPLRNNRMLIAGLTAVAVSFAAANTADAQNRPVEGWSTYEQGVPPTSIGVAPHLGWSTYEQGIPPTSIGVAPSLGWSTYEQGVPPTSIGVAPRLGWSTYEQGLPPTSGGVAPYPAWSTYSRGIPPGVVRAGPVIGQPAVVWVPIQVMPYTPAPAAAPTPPQGLGAPKPIICMVNVVEGDSRVSVIAQTEKACVSIGGTVAPTHAAATETPRPEGDKSNGN